MQITLTLFITVILISLICEYMDASIGMGYGTTLTPLLMIIGFLPLQVVPAVLLGQLVGGFIGAFFHHRVGNANFDFRQDTDVKKRLRLLGYLPKSTDAKVVLILVVCGIFGAIAAVFFATNIPTLVLKIYIGVVVVGVGALILVRRNHQIKFSWKGLIAIGLIGSFNKGTSGGGYGPLVTGGQLVSGREAKSSIGSATLAEAIVCVVPFVSYAFITGNIYWKLAAATSVGSIVAAPFAALTVKKIRTGRLKLIVGIALCLLGAFTLVKTFIG